MKKVLLVTALIVVALISGAFAGAAYQKEQPVELAISWYNSTDNTASFDTHYLRVEKGMITIVPDRNITYYNILLSQVDKKN